MKNEVIHVRLTQKQKKELEKKLDGRPTSKFIRQLIEDYLKKGA